MTSRQIIKAVLTFESPPRIGMTLPKPYPNDFLGRGRKTDKPRTVPLEPRGSELRRWRDEWGVVWVSLTEFDKGEVVEPAIRDWSDLDGYVPPDLGRPGEYAEAARAFADDIERFRVSSIPGFTFNVARKLRRLENYLCDLLLERPRIDKLHEIVRGALLAAIDRIAEAGADAVTFCEDWGTQDRLMISPDMWREIFKPEFRVLAGRAHEHGLFVLMHSCGKMTAVIEDMIECGIDGFQFDQPRLHGIECLAERFGGRATFWCPVDIQTTLQTRDADRIRADARLMIEKLGGADGLAGFRGGFIAGYYGGNEAIGLTPDVQDAACKAFVEYASYT